MFIEPNPVVSVVEEYRSGTGKVLTAGDEVKVQGRKGRWVFREALHREDGRVDLLLIGKTKPYRGKHGYARPQDCARTAKAGLGRHATTARQRWGADLVDGWRGEDEPAIDEPTVAEVEVAEGHELLRCEQCGQDWTRERVRGRKPKRCPSCR